MNSPKPHDPRAAHVTNPEEIAGKVNEVLSREAETLRDEALNLEEAHRILNDALS
ncbi:hypothetical protein cgp_1599 [Corynebacterium glutamicum MB001]|uniref:Uncharacterized protein n=3 Tax=Corynebacterium glutamicum TaxID=1718 RepID=Q8NQM3_CORGL|nr:MULTISPECIES: hypothetical protein [Corynebacterium]AGN19147.1 hypothetical protein C624_07850 [Corynebacterium glutamicum SCgG1]AGN22172.1 hypothetical protein C629_07860 [Corynebacterium glutamicum SCgG2]AGT05378.1 hypothetical protein cgp_1599 [Corynebacterium glutamicum MB001]AJE67355.1 hypothetical protein SB89_07285 [Corynebacterium glutamicum]ALP50112.1 hypothetical protein AC079_07835 [Corynebacterium glutamicum]